MARRYGYYCPRGRDTPNLLGIGGMQLFSAEAPGTGIGGDKIHPRISDTAKRLWICISCFHHTLCW